MQELAREIDFKTAGGRVLFAENHGSDEAFGLPLTGCSSKVSFI
jgi:hypothetical protein